MLLMPVPAENFSMKRRNIPLASCVNPSLIRAYSVNEESRIQEALDEWYDISHWLMEVLEVCIPVVPMHSRWAREVCEEGQAHQFLVPPIYSGKLNVGLATTAPIKWEESKRNMNKVMVKFNNRPKQSVRTSRLIDEQLQRQRASMHSLFPWTLVSGFPDPRIPVTIRRLRARRNG